MERNLCDRTCVFYSPGCLTPPPAGTDGQRFPWAWHRAPWREPGRPTGPCCPLNPRPGRQAGCLKSASCPCNRAGTNNGALVQTRFAASKVTLEMLLHKYLGRLLLRSTQPRFPHGARLRGPDHHPLPRGWLCLHGEVSSGARGGTQRLVRVRPEDEIQRPREQSTTARSLPRPLPRRNERGRSADQTDKRPSQEGGGQVAAHTNFVPDVTQPWLSDGAHAKARSPTGLEWCRHLAPPGNERGSPCGSSHPGEGTHCFLNHLGTWGTFSHHTRWAPH